MVRHARVLINTVYLFLIDVACSWVHWVANTKLSYLLDWLGLWNLGCCGTVHGTCPVQHGGWPSNEDMKTPGQSHALGQLYALRQQLGSRQLQSKR